MGDFFKGAGPRWEDLIKNFNQKAIATSYNMSLVPQNPWVAPGYITQSFLNVSIYFHLYTFKHNLIMII